jgi:hypothetical protein
VRVVVEALNIITTHCSNRLGRLEFSIKVLLMIFDLTKRPKFYQFFGQANDPVCDNNARLLAS